ncbi:MAG: hypothetical protein NC102_11570 [Clostridium sp.]|nr:hypothetical protein [Clostridium sp.]
MPKKGATSANMKPCNCANAERHCNPKQRAKLDYVNHDLTPLNVVWHRYTDKKLTECFDEACQLFTASTGQKPQLGKVYRLDKKTNRKRLIDGFAPIREMVVVTKATTTEEDIDRLLKEMQKKFGITPLAFSIHNDEGHYERWIDPYSGKVNAYWQPNRHAHLYFDVMERREVDHAGKPIPEKKRGRTIKFTEVQTRMMQDLTAEALGMERGEIGSRRTHEDQIEYKRDAQAKELSDGIVKINTQKAEILRLEGIERDLSKRINGKSETAEKIKNAADWLVGKSKRRADKAERELEKLREQSEKALEKAEAANASEYRRGHNAGRAFWKSQLDQANRKTAEAEEERDNAYKRGVVDGKATANAIVAQYKAKAERCDIAEKKAREAQDRMEAMSAASADKERQINALKCDLKAKDGLAMSLLDLLWKGARGAIEAIVDYIHDRHAEEFSLEQAEDIDRALGIARTMEHRLGLGRRLIEITKMIICGVSEALWKDATDKVDEVAKSMGDLSQLDGLRRGWRF